MPLKVITNFQEHQLELRNWARAEIYDFGVDLDYKNILLEAKSYLKLEKIMASNFEFVKSKI